MFWKFIVSALLLPCCLGIETATASQINNHNQQLQVEELASSNLEIPLISKEDSLVESTQETDTDKLKGHHHRHYRKRHYHRPRHYHRRYYNHHRRRHYYRPRHHRRYYYHPQRHYRRYYNHYYYHPQRHYRRYYNHYYRPHRRHHYYRRHHHGNSRYLQYINYRLRNDPKLLRKYLHLGEQFHRR